jgi:hypothetical protein
MRRRLLLWALGMAAGTALAQPPQVTVRGQVTTSSGEHPAWFTLICAQGQGAALSLQFTLGTDAAPGFPFDAYEGPGAPAAELPSALLQVDQQRFAPTQVAGWLSGDQEGAFVFGIATLARKQSTATDIAVALGTPGVTLRWTQSGNNLQTAPLVGEFVPDAQQSRELARIAAPCLPKQRIAH